MAKDEDPKPKAPGSAAGSKAGGNGASAQQSGGVQGGGATSAVEALKADHRKVEGLFDRFAAAKDSEKVQVIEQICDELIVHATIEEEIFYPACRQAADAKLLDEAQVEHDCAKVLILQLLDSRGDAFRDAKVKVLAEEIRAHIREEEAPSGLMAKAQGAGVDTPELAARLERRKRDLLARLAEHAAPAVRMPTFSHYFNPPQQKESSMSRQYESQYDRDRDERGRFVSDDDDRRRGYRSDSRGRDEDDDRGRRGYEERASYARSRQDDDDDRRYRSMRDRGHGGWFGDSEGHSEASRRGWDERESGARYRDDDDRRYASRGRDDDDYRSSRGQGGWFGDSEGHSEAARRGWDERGGSGYSRSRSRDDDDRDRRSSGGRGGHGGWFGDSEGHSEASRRGWNDRR